MNHPDGPLAHATHTPNEPWLGLTYIADGVRYHYFQLLNAAGAAKAMVTFKDERCVACGRGRSVPARDMRRFLDDCAAVIGSHERGVEACADLLSDGGQSLSDEQ